MKSHAEVVVIGGGVVGCSVLFHLARKGCKDALLIERSELTCGSSWHAAGGMHMLNGDPNVAGLQKYTIEVMEEIEKLSGQDCGVHRTGAVLLAGTEDRLDWLRMLAARGRFHGADQRIISLDEAKELLPIMDSTHFVGALHDPLTSHVDPSGVTHAYAKAAQALGASVVLRNRVVDTVQRSDRGWDVVTEHGTVKADHVINAGGLWAREVGRMAGLELPVLAMEHHFILTDTMPEVVEHQERTGLEMIHATDFSGELYMRQERDGMLMGTYERACVPWSERETPWDFGPELLPPDLDRIMPSLEVAFEHFPPFARVGIREMINGPFTFAPDGNPLVGPVRGLGNYWVAVGVMAGFSQAGGVGWALANWILDGDPGEDVWGMDVARYGGWAMLAYTHHKQKENYSRRFSIRYPNEELPAARPLRTTPIHDRLREAGAQFGDAWGLEVPLWFAPPGVEDVFSWHRSVDFEHVGAECRAVREGVGLSDISGFAKYLVAGAGARDWLDRVLAGRVPKAGRIVLAPMLKEDGKLIGDFTLANLGPRGYFIAGSGPAEEYHLRWFHQHLPDDGSVELQALGTGWCGLSIAGPASRAVLQSVTAADVSAEAFKFMDIREIDLGMAPAVVGRITFTGDLGYEIWCGPDYQRYLYDLLTEAGKPHGMRPFGSRALNALRLEKGFGTWARDFRPLYGPLEAGLDRFVAYRKEADFVGKAAALREREVGGSLRRLVFAVDATTADVLGDEPVWHQGEVCGWVTSGGYAHASGVSVAIAYVPKERADAEEGWEIEVLGERLGARILRTALFDHNGERMRN